MIRDMYHRPIWERTAVPYERHIVEDTLLVGGAGFRLERVKTVRLYVSSPRMRWSWRRRTHFGIRKVLVSWGV